MLYAAPILFALAAVGGLTLAIRKFIGKGLSMPLAIIHGLLAASGLVVLILYAISHWSTLLTDIDAGLFVVVALGGLTAFSLHLRKRKQPNSLIVVHGSAAIISFVVLLVAVFR